MKKFVCPVCGYVHEGAEAPEVCPVCKVPGSKFNEMVEGAALAAEHEYGVYAKTVKNNPDISEEDKKFIFEQLFLVFGIAYYLKRIILVQCKCIFADICSLAKGRKLCNRHFEECVFTDVL